MKGTAGVAAGLALVVAGMAPAQATTGEGAGAGLAPLLRADADGVIPGEYIVVLDQTSAAADVDRVVGSAVRAGGTVSAQFTKALRGFAAELSPEALLAVRAADGVKFVEANVQYDMPELASAPALAGPDDVQPDATWGIDRSDQRKLPLNEKYKYKNTGEGVNAYIIDSGMRITHRDFGGRAEYGWDVVGDDPAAPDCYGHGTHVGGTVGSSTYGIAKKVRLLSVNICDGFDTTHAYVIEAVEWVTANAEFPAVANISLVFSPGWGIKEAVEGSIQTGIVYAVGAGNYSEPACISEPASVDQAITAGASNSSDRQDGYSNFGTCVDLYAPGVGITSTGHLSDTATAVMSGTSSSSAHTAGVAALYLERHPNAKPKAVEKALTKQATKGELTDLGPDSPNKLLYSLVK